jgi:hypothetical protein
MIAKQQGGKPAANKFPNIFIRGCLTQPTCRYIPGTGLAMANKNTLHLPYTCGVGTHLCRVAVSPFRAWRATFHRESVRRLSTSSEPERRKLLTRRTSEQSRVLCIASSHSPASLVWLLRAAFVHANYTRQRGWNGWPGQHCTQGDPTPHKRKRQPNSRTSQLVTLYI